MLEAIVSESVFLYCKPTISALRFFGAAPFAYHKKKACFVLRKSRKCTFYSYGIAAIFVGSCIFGLWCDLTACGKDYFRVREDVDVYINTFDLGIVSMSIFFGILMSPMKVGDLLGILQCLNKVDATLNLPLSILNNDRKLSIVVLFLNYSISIMGIVLEAAYKLVEDQGDSQLHYIRNYGTVMLFFTLISTQQLAYWNIIRFVKGRMRSMNKSIEFEIVRSQKFQNVKVGEVFSGGKLFGGADVDAFHKRMEENCFHVGREDSTLQRLRHLMNVHEQIYLCVNYINKFFDYPILLIVINCIIEMIINPWILIIRAPNIIGSDKWLLISWICLRVIQLFLLIEPIQGVLVEQAKTNFLTMQLLKHVKDGPIRREMELLFMQNQMCKIEFTSVDMISLNRSIYATVSSAVTTYLVILIQFNK